MNDKLISLFSRVAFLAAFLLLAATVVEAIANGFGYTVLRGEFTAGRVMEVGAMLLIFVIALTLRQVRDELRKTG
jgi:hypothetical protein